MFKLFHASGSTKIINNDGQQNLPNISKVSFELFQTGHLSCFLVWDNLSDRDTNGHAHHLQEHDLVNSNENLTCSPFVFTLFEIKHPKKTQTGPFFPKQCGTLRGSYGKSKASGSRCKFLSAKNATPEVKICWLGNFFGVSLQRRGDFRSSGRDSS